MANHKSAEKRARQALKRRDRNRRVMGNVRAAVKAFRAAAEGDGADAPTRLREAERELRKAVSRGVIPKRRASRSVSRLARKLQAPRES